MSSNEMTSMTTSSGELLAENKVPIWRLRKAFANYLALVPYLAFALFPFYIIAITSIKSKQEINNLGESPFWATGIAVENYTYLATNTSFFEHWMIALFPFYYGHRHYVDKVEAGDQQSR